MATWIRVDVDVDSWPEWDDCPPGAMQAWEAVCRIIARHGDNEAGQIERRRCRPALVARTARLDSGQDAGEILAALEECGLLEGDEANIAVQAERWTDAFMSTVKSRARNAKYRESVADVRACRTRDASATPPRRRDDASATSEGRSTVRDETGRDVTKQDPPCSPPGGTANLPGIEGPTPKPKAPDGCTVVVDLWREICVPAGMPDVNPGAWGKSTKAKASKAAKDPDELRALFVRASKAPHLRGENERGWRADLLWVLSPSGRERIEAGRYDPKAKHDPSQGFKCAVNPSGENTWKTLEAL